MIIRRNITFVIHPTRYEDYDILAIGSLDLLRQLERKAKGSHLIKKSKFGGIPILILDTTDTLKCARNCIKECKELYEMR